MPVRSVRGWQRILAGWLALWIAAVSADLPIFDACPMHAAGTVLAHMSSARAPVAAAGAADCDGQRGHAQPTDQQSGPHQSRQHRCTCLGHCCAATPLAFAAPQLALAFRPTAPMLAPVVRPADVLSSWGGFALPFATAPPLA